MGAIGADLEDRDWIGTALDPPPHRHHHRAYSIDKKNKPQGCCTTTHDLQGTHCLLFLEVLRDPALDWPSPDFLRDAPNLHSRYELEPGRSSLLVLLQQGSDTRIISRSGKTPLLLSSSSLVSTTEIIGFPTNTKWIIWNVWSIRLAHYGQESTFTALRVGSCSFRRPYQFNILCYSVIQEFYNALVDQIDLGYLGVLFDLSFSLL